MAHLTDDLTILAGNSFDGMDRTIRIVLRIHTWFTVKVNVLAENLSIVTELCKFLSRHDKLPFTVRNRNSVDIAHLHTSQP
ncbi:Uncharacterised protein [Streptococcus pneumoniae]|nr:Uncharacterised protein [Streptococcus pneumoniae]